MGYKAFNFILFRTFINIFEEIKKKKGIPISLHESVFLSLLSILLFLNCSNLLLCIIISLLYIFARFLIIKTLPEVFYKIRYYNLKIEKTYITKIKKDKKKDKVIFLIYTYLTKEKILNHMFNFENFFSCSILSVNQDKNNKRKFEIIAQKGKSSNSLSSIMSGYGHIINIKKDTESDFYRKIEAEINANIKDITKLKDDISFKLKKRVTIELENGRFIFKIFKNNKKIYKFEDAIKNITPPQNFQLPFLVGIDQESCEFVIADLAKTLNCFINGIVGSGKSFLFHGIIQSILLWNKNIKMIFVDFKRVEFPRYRNLDNTIVMSKMDDFIEFLDNILKKMDERYILFEGSNVVNITEYNEFNDDKLPFIIICIDEIAFISSQKNASDIWQKLITLIQLGRAAGIILIAATQCPDHTQINTSFRRQMDGKLIGKLSRQSDLKICGIDSKEDVTNFKVGEFLIDLTGIGKKKIKSLFINGLTDSLTTKNVSLTKSSNQKQIQAISGFDDSKNGKNAESKNNSLTQKMDLLKLCENYFKSLERDTVVPTFKEAKNIFADLTSSKYKTIKIKLCKAGVIYKTSPKSTKYKIK